MSVSKGLLGWDNAKAVINLSEEEVKYLKRNGLNISGDDITNIMRTLGTEKVFVSNDCKALFYKGKIYLIYVPNKTTSFEPIWKLDGKKEVSSTKFDAWAGVLGVSLEEIPKENIFTKNKIKIQDSKISSTDKNVSAAGFLHVLTGLGGFLKSSLKKSEVVISFQSAEPGIKRAIISVGNSDSREHFWNLNYNTESNTYLKSIPEHGQGDASEYAKGLYSIITGEELLEDKTYTVVTTWDERHKEDSLSGYLYYSDKRLMYQPVVYSGNTARISTCNYFTGLEKDSVLECTDLLDNPSYAQEECHKILEKALGE